MTVDRSFNVSVFQAKLKTEGKKLRDDKEKVMEVLFGLFEKHQYYNIKDLVKETRQPVTYLKVSCLFTFITFSPSEKKCWDKQVDKKELALAIFECF